MDTIEFVWGRCCAGYRLRPRLDPGDEESREPTAVLVVEPASDEYETYRPTESALFQIFADKEASPEGMLDFTNKYGIVDWGGPRLFSELAFKGDLFVDAALVQQDQLRRALALAEAGDWEVLAEFYNSEYGPAPSRGAILPKLRARPQKKPDRVFVPSGLCQFLWFQFSQYVSSNGVDLLRCEWCNKPFLVGQGTRRRDSAKFCSNSCKTADFKHRQRG